MSAAKKRIWLWAIRTLVVAVGCLCLSDRAFAQQGVFGSLGAGLSVTPKADDPGIPLIGPGVGGIAPVFASDVGGWLSRRFGVAGELTLGLPFEVQQTEGGVGLCCAELTREHRLMYLSGVAKVRLVPGLVLQGGVSALRISTKEVRVTTPIGGTPQAPRQSSFSRTRAAWLIGAEGEVPVSRSLQLVPAVRMHVNFPKDEIAELNPLALGNATLRFTLSLRGTTGR